MRDYTRVLEFDKVLGEVGGYAATIMGAELVRMLTPGSRLANAQFAQSETTQAVGVLDRYGSIPLGGIEDIREPLARAEVESILSPRDLISIHNTLQSCSKLREFLIKLSEEDFPLLKDIGHRMESHDDAVREIGRAISQAGEVLDSASPALQKIRNDIRRNQQQLTEKLQSYMQNSTIRTALQDPVVTVRSDRYCLPVKSEYRSHVPGIVHDSSASGATLFIEPTAVVELGNKRRELVVKEIEEVEKVLSRLSGIVGAQASRMSATLYAATQMDCISARARYAAAKDCMEPVINERGVVRLIKARHPLLKGNVVPIDVQLGVTYDALLVTGPNTGGKTVSLKTIGLLTLMAAAGLWIPAADNSEVSLFTGVFADIGDEQSIEQSLSTFSSHMTNIADIANAADSRSLVLLDEIGAGTDPAEGAALAKAVIDHLLSRGAKVVATTHYGELKEYAYSTDRVQNASAEFDLKTLSPTYRLLSGVPGSSNAFIIAERIGLDKRIVDSARANINKRGIESEELMRRIEETQRAASQERLNAERMSSEAVLLKSQYEKQVTTAAEERGRVLQKTREKASGVIQDYSNKLDDVLEELARQRLDQNRSEALRKKAEKLIDDMSDEIANEVGQPSQEEKLPEDEPLKVGTKVRIAGMSQDVEVIDTPSDGKVVVMAGTMRINVPIASLRRAVGDAGKNKSEPQKQPISISLRKTLAFHSEIDLRAKRVEPALLELDKYLDDAVSAGAQSVRIIHGKGTGAMRAAVTEYLKDNRSVLSFRIGDPEEGGSGVTVATLG